jgi:CDP-glucose 4,6-dehydratase
MNVSFWKNKRVLITGHTGFKGSWLSHWLLHSGARVYGYALEAPTKPSLYELTGLGTLVEETIADIRDADALSRAILKFSPEIIFHMAAQPLVRDSYDDPIGTYSTNVMGTVNLLDAVRKCDGIRAVVNITTDKCYENQEWLWGYRENEPLGGFDPYSSSKACSEIVTAAYRRSFFGGSGAPGIASGRAGNVIGGGDFAKDRLIPDCVRAVRAGQQIVIRYPKAVRPWQHVLEPVSGYMILAEKLYAEPTRYSSAYNFGPEDSDARPVEWIAQQFCGRWEGASYTVDPSAQPHEAHFLKLDISKARSELGFKPRWNLGKAIDMIVQWTSAHEKGDDLLTVCLSQIEEYTRS